MITFSYTIKASNGIHARPAGMLVSKAKELDSDICIECKKKEADLKKLMALMLLNVKKGDKVQVKITGKNEQKDAKVIKTYFEKNF